MHTEIQRSTVAPRAVVEGFVREVPLAEQPAAADLRHVDVELVVEARARNVDAIHRLYAACSPVYGYIHRRYNDASFAKEIFQDTVTEIWRGSSPFVGNSKLSTWAIGIARHLAADALRKRGTVVDHDDEQNESGPAVSSSDLDPFEALAQRQARESVSRCLHKLSPKLGEVLQLVYYAELPQAEIAGMLGLNINTVKTRVRDAHLKVRACLSQRARDLS